MRLSEQLAAFAATTRYEDLPASAVRSAKTIILDTLAVAWAGTASPGSDAVLAMEVENGGARDSTVWGFGDRLPASAAAFVNGVAAAALDFDSLHVGGTAHAAVVVLPGVLALAEKRRLSGRELLTAFLVGHELTCRLGLSTPNHTGWFYTSIHGTYGAAAACARVLGLDAGRIEHALGMALGQAAGTQQANVEQCFMKRLQSAFAARAGVAAARLAERGATAPLHAIDGPFGHYALYEKGDAGVLLEGLGIRFHTQDTTFKKFPSCGCNHASIEAALTLRQRLPGGDPIERVEVRITPYMNRLVGAPFDPSSNPEVAAQFSVQYSVASALRRGHLGVVDLRSDAVRDPDIGRLARGVEVRIDDSSTSKLSPSTVSVTLASGTRLDETCGHVPGGPEQPMTATEFAAKAQECFSVGPRGLGRSQAAALMRRIDDLEAMEDVSELFDGLAAGSPHERLSASA